MSSHKDEPQKQGASRISLQNGFLSVSVLPAAGGNITELIDQRTGRNWLWNNPHLPIGPLRQGQDYGKELDSGGWDEILLSVSPDQLDIPGTARRQVPDHGDLVRQNWAIVDSDDDTAQCRLQVRGDLLNYRFERAVVLADNQPRMHLHYALTNNEPFSWPWYWSTHALISAEAGMQIELPAAQPFRVDNATGKLNPAERIRRWPDLELSDDSFVDLSNSFPKDRPKQNFARKIFVEAPASGAVSVALPESGEKLTLSFDRKQLPWLGLWINNKGWSGCGSEPYRNLGLEPCTTPYDSVMEAIGDDAITWIQPGETRKWSLTVDLAA